MRSGLYREGLLLLLVVVWSNQTLANLWRDQRYNDGGCNPKCVHGRCERPELSYGQVCFCDEGYKGKACDIYEECNPACVHGKCYWHWDSFDSVCICDEGYTGDTCDELEHGRDECLYYEVKCAAEDKCIAQSRKCDGRSDCSDGSDEANCSECSDRGYGKPFKCLGEDKCILSRKICNGMDDCSDGSDEADCPCTVGDGWKFPGQRWCVDDDCYLCQNSTVQTLEAACDANQYKCTGPPDSPGGGTDYFCHPMEWKCNGYRDCASEDDEANCKECSPGATEEINPFKCKTDDVCVLFINKCDGERDCPDGSDEDECNDCLYGRFKCETDDKCIDFYKVCDGSSDCPDGSDEKSDYCVLSRGQSNRHINLEGVNSRPGRSRRLLQKNDGTRYLRQEIYTAALCNATEFSCPGVPGEVTDVECLPNEWKCDGEYDCPDESDETDCTECFFGAFKCDGNDTCLPFEWKCDGIPDCSDASDEVDCENCSYNAFKCEADDKCIPIDKKCDDLTDCSDNSDEADCGCQDGDNSGPVFWCVDDKCYICQNNTLIPVEGCQDGDNWKPPGIWCVDDKCYLCQNNTNTPLEGCQFQDSWKFPGQPWCVDDKCYICQNNTINNFEAACNATSFSCPALPGEVIDFRCLPNEWKCDGINDCPDKSDEADCKECSSGYNATQTPFKCKADDKCIPFYWKCDGYDDCPDKSDEDDCNTDLLIPGKKMHQTTNDPRPIPKKLTSRKMQLAERDSTCSSTQFKCWIEDQCIPKDLKCDGIPDCMDESDELYVVCNLVIIINMTSPGKLIQKANGFICNSNQFKCRSEDKCIPEAWRCDGLKGCIDESDETDCKKCSSRSLDSPFPFKCETDDKCIPYWGTCDGAFNCPDLSDEIGCVNCSSSGFKCETIDLCIPYDWKCDGDPQCTDGSDEVDCGPLSKKNKLRKMRVAKTGPISKKNQLRKMRVAETGSICNSSQFKCQSEDKCIPEEWRCDGMIDCKQDKSDETNCSECLYGVVRCKDQTCILSEYICDEDLDCSDGSDEANCTGECLYGAMKCNDQDKCVSSTYLCDGERDCLDGSDEAGCTSCMYGLFHCEAEKKCLSDELLCNGKSDCADGSDEESALCRKKNVSELLSSRDLFKHHTSDKKKRHHNLRIGHQ